MIKQYFLILFILLSLNSISQLSCSVHMGVNFNATTESVHFNAQPILSPSDDYVEYYVWTFGDGASSNEANPIHHYLLPGTYQVCLTIRTFMGCNATICSDIEVNFCNLVIIPTIQNVSEHDGNDGAIDVNIDCCGIAPYEYLWSTGDTTQSTDSLPAGTYSLTVCDVLGCCQIKDYTITEPPGIHGKVYAGTSLLPNGIAIAYFSDNNTTVAESFSQINNGDFTLTRYNTDGNYYIYAIPDFNINQPFIPIYFPTYKSDSINWVSAEPYNNDTVIIHLKSNYDINIGVGKISGNIIYTTAAAYETDVYGKNWFDTDSSVYANAAKNIPVMLLNQNNIPVRFTLSKNNGDFEFKDIPYGTYTIYAEKAGFTTYPPSVTINSTEPDYSGIQLFISSDYIDYTINNINETDNKIDILLYPNPAQNNIIHLKFPGNKTIKPTIKLISQTGQHINLQPKQEPNTQTFSLNIAGLANGVYTLIIKTHNDCIRKKLIICK